MRRHMELIGQILGHVEASECYSGVPVPEFEEYTEAQVHYHVGLCEEAGYLVASPPRCFDGVRRFPGLGRLTWAGRDALDAIRSA